MDASDYNNRLRLSHKALIENNDTMGMAAMSMQKTTDNL